jgi:hypothetical protein
LPFQLLLLLVVVLLRWLLLRWWLLFSKLLLLLLVVVLLLLQHDWAMERLRQRDELESTRLGYVAQQLTRLLHLEQ